MKAIGSAIWSVPRAIAHAIWRFSSLVHNYDEIRETYPVNPDGLTEQQLAASNLAANLIGSNGTGAM
jgi:hypothetical protein